jgi:hypothetical protein
MNFILIGGAEAGVEIAPPLRQRPVSLAGGPLRFDLHCSASVGLIVAKARALPILRLFHKLLVREDVKEPLIKFHYSLNISSGAKQAAEKGSISGKLAEKFLRG